MKIILLHYHSSSNNLAYIMPIVTATLVFVANVFYQQYLKKKATRERLSNEIIDTCDKMIRYLITAESSILTCRVHAHLSNIVADEKTKKEQTDYSDYYHRKAEDIYLKYEFLK